MWVFRSGLWHRQVGGSHIQPQYFWWLSYQVYHIVVCRCQLHQASTMICFQCVCFCSWLIVFVCTDSAIVVSLSVCLFNWLSICLTVCLTTCVTVSDCLTACVTVCLTVRLHVWLCLTVWLYVKLHARLCIPLHILQCLTVCMAELPKFQMLSLQVQLLGHT